MLIDHLLPSVAVEHDGEIIESSNKTANLKSVRQIHRNGNVFLSKRIQKRVLDIDRLIHYVSPYARGELLEMNAAWKTLKLL